MFGSGGGTISAVAVLWTCCFMISSSYEMWHCRDFPRFLDHALYHLYAATMVHRAEPSRAPELVPDVNGVQSAEHRDEISETSPTNRALVESSGEGWLGKQDNKLSAQLCMCLCTLQSTTCPLQTVGVQKSNRQWGHCSSVAKFPCGATWCERLQSDRQFFLSISKLSLFFFLFFPMVVDPHKFQKGIPRLSHSI